MKNTAEPEWDKFAIDSQCEQVSGKMPEIGSKHFKELEQNRQRRELNNSSIAPGTFI